jgi:hypothetical protein
MTKITELAFSRLAAAVQMSRSVSSPSLHLGSKEMIHASEREVGGFREFPSAK